ncbi:unnamed protein product [Adineta steineri]|uniref:NAD(P)(+)--arginine ADP-ribosyltransferase n=1 Tax=Adineta steineri TaxID=433720 RepID=A0A815GJR5_9BILA|nr:unnamed protein product [Adineta steineri]CAF1544261.1 unnamed protein product [Adineta steineri]
MAEQNSELPDSINQLLNILNSFQIPTNTDEDSSEILLKIVKYLNAYHGSLLYLPSILSHGLFAKLRVCYRLFLKKWRLQNHSSNEFDQQQKLCLSEVSALFGRLSIGITDTNIHLMKLLFFNKSFVDEFIDCLNAIISGQQDSLLLIIIQSLISAFSRLALKMNINSDPMLEQLTDAITEYVRSVDLKKEMLTPNVTADQRLFIRICLDYLINCKGQRRRYLHIAVRRSQFQHFIEWIQEENRSLVGKMTIETVTIVDYIATIFSTRQADEAFASDALVKQYLDMYDWSLGNWKQTSKTIDKILVPVILQDFDPLKPDEVIYKHREKRRRENQIRIAKRNREDTIIVWIYDNKTIEDNNLVKIKSHLDSIRYNICCFDISQSVSSALDFILSHRSNCLAILIDAVALPFILNQILDAVQFSSTIFVYNSKQEIPFVSFFSSNIQSCITSLATDVEWKTIFNTEMLFCEPNQIFSVEDMPVSSAHIMWHLLLVEALTNMPTGSLEEFVTAAQLWYSTNTVALLEIDYFKINYRTETPELWYNATNSTIIQRILRNAFKRADIETLYFARSIIIDISRKISSTMPSSIGTRRIFACSIMNKRKTKFLFDHQDSLIMPVDFLVGHVSCDKIIDDLRRLPNKDFDKVLFEIDVDNHVPVLDLGADGVLFNIGVLFQLIHIVFDSACQIYYFRVQTVPSSNVAKRLIDKTIQLREQVGESTDRRILFGSLLAHMNCVRSAMNYFLFYNNYDENDKEMEINTLAELGRISLRCNELVDAEKFLLAACDLYKRSQIAMEDSVIGRIRTDLVLILVRLGRNIEANALCQETLQFLCDSPQSLSLELLNIAQGRVSLCAINDELAQATFDNLCQEYKRKSYQCQYAALIGGNAIDIGDMYRDKNLLSMAHKCYLFAYSISEHNQLNTHPMMIALLHRLSQLLDQKPSSNEIETKLTDVWQIISYDDVDSQENRMLVDAGRNLALFYVKKCEYSKATAWFEMCLSVYRQQWPKEERYIHQCQAYILKHRVGLKLITSVETLTTQASLQVNDIVLSMEYEHLIRKQLLQETADEENRRWEEAMMTWKQNMEVDSGIVTRQLVVWIEPNLQTLNTDQEIQEIIRTSPYTDFHPFEDVDSAVFFLIRDYQFIHVQVVVANSIADEFFEMQEIAQLQKTCCLTMCVFVFDADETEEIDRYNRYLTYLPCGRKCWLEERDHDERCLIMSRDRFLCKEFCLRKDTLGMYIAMIIRLVDIGGFGNIFTTEVDNERNKIMFTKDDHHHIDFVGFMSGYNTATPKVFNHLRFAKPLNMQKNDVQIATLVMFARRHNLTDQQIAIICRYFSTGNCIRSVTFIKYLVRLWSLESPVYFYRLVNTALAECCVEDLHYLRFIIYDYLEMFYAKSLPYFAGTLYRGISTTDENIAMLMSLEGQKIYFVCFTATSKNRARAQVGGNVLFEIETLSDKSQEAQKLYSNADISIVSQFPEEEEVLYAPLATFHLTSVRRDEDNSGTERYTVRLRELGGGSFLSMLHIDKIRRMPNASPFLTGTDHWQINISKGKCFIRQHFQKQTV